MNPAPTLHIAMPTPSRALTNDYNACKLIMLEANDPTSPLVVTQEVYAPSDPNFRKRVFYLQRDGMWIDEIAHSTLPHTEAGDIVLKLPPKRSRHSPRSLESRSSATSPLPRLTPGLL